MSAVGHLAPQVIAWTEAGGRPAIVMESLHDARWPAGVFNLPGTTTQPVVWKSGQLDPLEGGPEAGVYGPASAWLVKVFKRLALIDLHWASAALCLPVAAFRSWRSI